MVLSVSELRQKLCQFYGYDDHVIQGCSAREVESAEQTLGIELPQAYKEYLFAFGHNAGDLFNEVEFLLPDVLEAQKQWNEVASAYNLSKSVFIFLSRFDLYLFFDTANGDDPPIYRIIEEDQAPPEKVFDSFTEWLNDYILGSLEEIDR